MIVTLYIAAAAIMAVGSLYFAWRSRDFRKFLAGAFFVSSRILFYLYLADVGRSLGGEAFGGDRLVRHRLFDVSCRRGSSFLDLIKQPGLGRRRSPLSFRIVMGEAAGFEDNGAQLGGAAATLVVEVDKRKAGPGHRILQQRDRRCRRQAMLTAQVQESANKAVAAVSVVITAARPVAVVGERLEHEIEQLRRFGDFRLGPLLLAPDPG